MHLILVVRGSLSVRVGTCARGLLCALVLVPGVGVGPAGARHSWCLVARLRKLPLALLRFLLQASTLRKEKKFLSSLCLFDRAAMRRWMRG
jgi:hypothetical protein